MQMSKDVEFRGQRYQVGRLKAADGSWILVLLNNKMRTVRESAGVDDSAAIKNESKPTAEEGMRMTAAFLVSQLSHEELEEVTAVCLRRCSRYEDADGRTVPVPMPIMLGSQYAVAELEYDGPAVMELVRECLAFNIAPFFDGAGSNATNPRPASTR